MPRQALFAFRPALFALSLAAGLASSAFAQGGAAPQHLDGSFQQPLNKPSAVSGVQGTSSATIIERDGSDEYEVSIRDGQTTAKVNGSVVPADRVRAADGKIEILNDDGSVRRTLNVPRLALPSARGFWPNQDSARRLRIERTPGANSFRLAPFGGAAQGPMGPAPKVMMGINMTDLNDESRAELNLDQDVQGIVVAGVIKDLPAAKAGLREGDIIVAIDGERGVSSTRLRELLVAREPGSKLPLTVLRDGTEQSFTLDLVPYESRRLNSAWEMSDSGANWRDELIADLESSLEKVRAAGKDAGRDVSKIAEEALSHAIASLRDARNQAADVLEYYMQNEGTSPRALILGGPGPGAELFVPPTPPSPPAAPAAPGASAPPSDARRSDARGPADAALADRLDRLTDLLDRVNRRLDRMEERLNENDAKNSGTRPNPASR